MWVLASTVMGSRDGLSQMTEMVDSSETVCNIACGPNPDDAKGRKITGCPGGRGGETCKGKIFRVRPSMVIASGPELT